MAYCVPPPGGAIAWWSANGHALDLIGGHNGSTPSGMTYRTNYVGNYNTGYVGNYGIISAAFDFRAVSQRRVSIPDSPAFDLPSFTIEANVESVGTTGVIFDRGIYADWQAEHAWVLRMSGPRTIQFTVADTNAISASIQAYAPTNMLFHPRTEIAATFNGTNGEMCLYFDGVLATKTNTSVRPMLAKRSGFEPLVTIGNSGNSMNNYPFNGIIDDVVLYNRALSADEVGTWRFPSRCERNLPPVFTLQPTNSTLPAGSSLTLPIALENDTVLNSVQWYRNASPITGGTNRIFFLTAAQPQDVGAYFVQATNLFGSTISSTALVQVANAPTNLPVCEGLPNGAAAWWTFNLSLTDEISGIVLTNTGGLGFESGYYRHGYAFFNTNGAQYPSAPAGAIDIGTSDGMTIEGWFKPWTLGTQQVLAEWNDGKGKVGVNLVISIAQLGGLGSIFVNFTDTNNADHYLASNPAILKSNQWQHIAVTYDKVMGMGKIYLDGTLVATHGSLGVFTPQTTFPLVLGRRISGSGEGSQFQGVMDEVAFYRRALSGSEIRAIATAATKCNQPFLWPPIFTRQPVSRQVYQGATVRFEPEVSGAPPFAFQWYCNNLPIPGENYLNLALTNIGMAQAGSTYYLEVTNYLGRAVSSIAAITILGGPMPGILRQPSSLALASGETAIFTVQAYGAPLMYSWLKNGVYLPNATNNSLVISNITTSDAGAYNVRVSTGLSQTFSAVAYLVVTQAGPVCTEAAGGLLAWWRAEYNSADQLGFLPSFSNSTKFAQGKVGTAFFFDGAKDTVTNRFMPGITNVLDDYSYEFWARPTAGRAVTPEALGGIAGIQGQRYAIFPLNGGFGPAGSGVSVGTNGISVFEHSAVYLASPLVYERTNSNWMHIAVVYSNRVPSLYVDGVLVRVGLRSTRSSFPSTFLGMHDAMPTDYGHYAGLLDEVSIYSRPLSSHEVERIYLAGSAGKCLSATASPVIAQQPTSLVVTQGQTAVFTVSAAGAAPLSYYWTRNQSPVSGGTNATLIIENAQPGDAGGYSVRVTNSYGFAWSTFAHLTVIPAATPELRITSVSNVVIGATFSVPIEFTARGNENAMSFSLAFLPSRMTFDGIVLAEAAPGATTLVNTNFATNGTVGVAIAMPVDMVFRKGVLAHARFIGSTNSFTSPTPIYFLDSPVRREVAEVSGNLVNIEYINGQVSFTAGFEGDVAPSPYRDNQVRVQDWVLIGQIVAGKRRVSNGAEFMRADCAPRNTLGDGRLTVSDWTQVGRYVVGLDPLTPAGGPSSPVTVMPLTGPEIHKTSAIDAPVVTASSAGLSPGIDGSVLIEVSARGGENALGFSLAYNSSALEYRSTELAKGAAGAVLELNAEQAASGRLGAVLALPTGQSFKPGLQQVLRFTFRPKAGTRMNTAITFADEPVVREISDAQAKPVKATFVSSVVRVDSRPALALELHGDRAILRWPAWAANFALERTADPALGDWTPAPSAASVTPDACVMELPLSGQGQFFRLAQPTPY